MLTGQEESHHARGDPRAGHYRMVPMMNREEKTFQVELTTFTYGGETLGRLPDGRAVFVPYAMPGEEVRVRLTEDKERYARGEIVEMLHESPRRIEPRCKHFGVCGGCHYQHMPYEEQLKAKRDILEDQLQRIGDITDPAVGETVPSPQPWMYRNRMQFHLTDDGQLGFKKLRSDEVFAIDECHLPEEVLGLIWPVLDMDVLPGLNRIRLRSGEKEEDALLILESEEPEPIQFELDLPISAVHRGPGGQIVLSGDEFTINDIHGFPFVVSAGSFFQTNSKVTEIMLDHIFDEVDLREDMVVLDAYCGVGLFSVFFAREVERVVGVEASPSAAEDFMHNLSEFEGVELYEARVEDILPNITLDPDLILVDPPRAGLDGEVVDAILDLAPGRLIYVSCDPATLARDAKRFRKGGMHLEKSIPFDMFPQTYHIESVNYFRPQ